MNGFASWSRPILFAGVAAALAVLGCDGDGAAPAPDMAWGTANGPAAGMSAAAQADPLAPVVAPPVQASPQPTPEPQSMAPGAGMGMPSGDNPPASVSVNDDADAPNELPAMDMGPQAPVPSGDQPPEDDLPGPGQTPTFHVFLLLGQSNMEGYPKAQAADRIEDERIRVLGYDDCASTGRKRDEWDVAAPPLHSCWNDGLGPGDYFAKTLIEALPEGDTIGLVPCAINGERIETFMKAGGSKYDWIVQRARLAQGEGGVIAGVLFHQGESNSGDPAWPGKVSTLVEDLKRDLELSPVPFIAGELLHSGGTAGHNRLIAMLPGAVENGHVVSAEGLAVDPTDAQWNLHFGRDAQVELGKRYAQKAIEVLGL